MSRKKVGELYGTPIVTGNENTVENHELLLELNNDNTPKALKQRTTGDLFKSILGEGSGNNANPGYNVTKQTVTLFNDTIETQESQEMYQAEIENIDFDLIAGENYTVVFDGTSYNVKATASPYDEDDVLLGEMDNGGPSFETYPFVIIYADEEGAKNMMFATSTEGSHTVEIKHEEETVIPTPEFKSAVNSVTGYSATVSYNTYIEQQDIETTTTGGDLTAWSNEYQIDSPLVVGNTYKVTFEGVEYELVCYDDNPSQSVGAAWDNDLNNYDFSTYPFLITTWSDGEAVYSLATPEAGTYSVKVEEVTEEVTTTHAFESMIQGIVGSGSASGCQIIYPDSISWIDTLYSQYNNEPEAGNIYFIPFIDVGSTNGQYLYPVHIDELTNDDNQFRGNATIIGTPIIVDNGTLTVQPFDSTINPTPSAKGLCISYYEQDDYYKLSYDSVLVIPG